MKDVARRVSPREWRSAVIPGNIECTLRPRLSFVGVPRAERGFCGGTRPTGQGGSCARGTAERALAPGGEKLRWVAGQLRWGAAAATGVARTVHTIGRRLFAQLVCAHEGGTWTHQI